MFFQLKVRLNIHYFPSNGFHILRSYFCARILVSYFGLVFRSRILVSYFTLKSFDIFRKTICSSNWKCVWIFTTFHQMVSTFCAHILNSHIAWHSRKIMVAWHSRKTGNWWCHTTGTFPWNESSNGFHIQGLSRRLSHRIKFVSKVCQ